MATQRISDEPAFVLHRYDWSETSLIQDMLTMTSWLTRGQPRQLLV